MSGTARLSISGPGYEFVARSPRWWRHYWTGECTCGSSLKPILDAKMPTSLVLFFMENHAVLEHGRRP